jgi:long-chain acyl-CoA synthetase
MTTMVHETFSAPLPPVSAVRGTTIVDVFRETARTRPDAVALRHHDGSAWRAITWRAYERAVAEAAVGLRAWGLEPGDKVGILSTNRPEWHIADLAVLSAGLVSTPVYPTSSSSQIAYILADAEAKVCFVEDGQQLAKVLLRREQLPSLERIVVLGTLDGADDSFVRHLPELQAVGAGRLDDEPSTFDALVNAIKPADLATLVYTSGTTGPPKGTMITHANIMWTIRSSVSMFQIREGERLLSFLPLSHIAERMMSDFAPIAVGGETWFARSLATVAEDLRDCHPTVFFAVPRVWEKFQEAVLAKLGAEHGVKKLVIDRYLGLGQRIVTRYGSVDRAPIWESAPYRLLDGAVGAKVRHEMGLDQAHILITAAAAIHPDLIRWFHALGLPVVELYGQTEVCGPTTCNPPEANRVGAVGLPIPGVRVRIADDGEILVKGGNVCSGYFKDASGTAALLDEDGWMHSGDAGRLDANGYLHITGRKKDLIITAAGQNIAPQEIETDLRHQELISEAVVVGEGKRYLTALLALDGDALRAWAEQHAKVADYESLTADPDLVAEVDRLVSEVNDKRSRVERVRKFRILPHELTIAAGEMTPTLKVKRNMVYDAYEELIDEMYATD